MHALQSLADTVSRFALLSMVTLLPVFFVPTNVVSIPQSKLLLLVFGVTIAILAWFVARSIEGRALVPINVLFASAALLPLAYIVSAATAGFPHSAIAGGLGEHDTVAVAVLWFGALVGTAFIAWHSVRSVVLFARALLGGLFLLTLFQLLRLIAPDQLSFGGVFPNTTATAAGSWHDLGILMGLAAILATAFVRTPVAQDGLWRLVAIATAVGSMFLLVVISLTDTWYALAAAAALFTAHTVFALRTDHGLLDRVRQAWPWLALFVIGIVFGTFSTQIHNRLPETIRIVAVEVRPSWEGTFAVGQGISSEPRTLFFGSGPNSFSKNWGLYKPAEVNSTLFWNLDFNSGVGVVPTSFITLGALGVLSWAIIAAAFLFSLGFALRAVHTPTASRMVFVIAIAALYLFTFQIIYVPGVALSALLFVLLGLFVAVPKTEEPRAWAVHFGLRNLKQLGKSLAVVIPVVGIVAMGIFGGEVLASDIAINRSIVAFGTNNDMAKAREHIETALWWSPSNDRAHRAAVELGIVELARIAQSGAGEAATQQLQATLAMTIEHGLSAVTIDDSNYQNWLTIAQLYQELAGVGVEGAYEQAQAAYKEAQTDNPTSPLPLFRLAQLETARGNRAAALGYFDQTLALKPDFAAAHFLRSQVLAQDGRMQDAVGSALTAVQLVPQDPLGWYNLGTILYAGQSWNDAAVAFAQAVTVQADYSNAIFMLALTLAQLGNTEQALVALDRVAELNPQDTVVPAVAANIRNGRQAFEGLSQ